MKSGLRRLAEDVLCILAWLAILIFLISIGVRKIHPYSRTRPQVGWTEVSPARKLEIFHGWLEHADEVSIRLKNGDTQRYYANELIVLAKQAKTCDQACFHPVPGKKKD